MHCRLFVRLEFLYEFISFFSLKAIPLIAEIAKQEKENPEKKDEMSKNAQFRAIQPSKSILSFVEDNVICIAVSMCCLICFHIRR